MSLAFGRQLKLSTIQAKTCGRSALLPRICNSTISVLIGRSIASQACRSNHAQGFHSSQAALFLAAETPERRSAADQAQALRLRVQKPQAANFQHSRQLPTVALMIS